MDNMHVPSRIFDDLRQRQYRARRQAILARKPDADFLSNLMAEEILARLEMVTRSFTNVLVIGNATQAACEQLYAELAQRDSSAATPAIATIDMVALPWSSTHVICERWDLLPELPFQPDLIVALGMLDAANDLPGLLVQLRRALKPDGLLLAALFGAGSLATLKRAMLIADGERPAAHIHPQIDVRAIGDLLGRAGFTMPVADSDIVDVQYGDIRTLLTDIRTFGGSNALAEKSRSLSRSGWQRMESYIQQRSDNRGKTAETFHLVSASGWAPAPNQPKPARRGSATMSLAAQLEKGRSE